MPLGKDGWIRLVQNVDDSGNPTGGLASKATWDSVVKNCAVPGTAEQCTALAAPSGYAIVIKARSTNTEVVYIGKSQAVAQNAAKRVSLAAGQAVVLLVDDASDVWVDAVVAGEGIEAFVEQAS